MKTVDLIATLTTNVEAGDRRQMSRTLRELLPLAPPSRCCAALIVLGCRPDIRSDVALAFLVGKLIFRGGGHGTCLSSS